jgi:valyl-tRNA synthetase
MLSKVQSLVEYATDRYLQYDYAGARQAAEVFLWTELADNYIELVKQRLYNGGEQSSSGARFGLYVSLEVLIKILAPVLPYITEAVYQALYCPQPGRQSIHNSGWPQGNPLWLDQKAESQGQRLIEITIAVRRYKSEKSLSLATDLDGLYLVCNATDIRAVLEKAAPDLMSSTRARAVEVVDKMPAGVERLTEDEDLEVGITLPEARV